MKALFLIIAILFTMGSAKADQLVLLINPFDIEESRIVYSPGNSGYHNLYEDRRPMYREYREHRPRAYREYHEYRYDNGHRSHRSYREERGHRGHHHHHRHHHHY